MKTRPILFSDAMVRTILDGTKTQTRRIVKPQPPDDFFLSAQIVSKYGVPGDRLWVRECFRKTFDIDSREVIEYRSGGSRLLVDGKVQHGEHRATSTLPKWTPSIFMRPAYLRIMLEIVSVRIERLHEISEADAIAEGVSHLFTAEECKRPEIAAANDAYTNYLWHGHIGKTITRKQSGAWAHQYSSYKHARESYSSLWESINGPDSWASNPWVWVVEFKRILQ